MTTSKKTSTRSTKTPAKAARSAAPKKTAARKAPVKKVVVKKPTAPVGITAAAAAAPAPEVQPDAPALPGLRKKEILDLVVAHSGEKRNVVKPVVEAFLDVLGGALREGRDVTLQPLGKLKVTRSTKKDDAKVMTLRMRQLDKVRDDLVLHDDPVVAAVAQENAAKQAAKDAQNPDAPLAPPSNPL